MTPSKDFCEFIIKYQNVRGLKTKTHDFYLGLIGGGSDIIVLTETNLDDGVSSSELFGSEYIVYRCDRDKDISGKKSGGGVLIAVHRSVPSFDTTGCLQSQNLEMKSVRIKCETIFITLVVVYIRPNSNVDVYISLYDYLETLEFVYNSKVLILGDFNIPKFITGSRNLPIIRDLYDFMSFLNLYQCNYITNHNDVILDLAITNIASCRVVKDKEPLVGEDSHHPSLSICFQLTKTKECNDCSLNQNRVKYNFRKADFLLMYQLVVDVDWTVLHQYQNCVDDYVREFYSVLYDIFDRCVPKVVYSNHYPVWFSKEIKKQLREKRHWRKLYLKYGKLRYRKKFENTRDTVKAAIELAYNAYLQACEERICHDSGFFWTFVNSKKGNSSIPATMTMDNNVCSGGREIADAFATYFESMFVDCAVSTEEFDQFYLNRQFSHSEISVTSVTDDEIVKFARKIKSNAIGPDCIPGYVFKGLIEYLTTPLKTIYNMCLSRGVFPSVWKQARVCPVLKSGDKSKIENYRPISILSFPSKIFEQIIYTHVFDGIGPSISSKQHGFVPARSTVTNLSCVAQFIAGKLDIRGQVDAIYLDLTKAFDKINHTLLIAKLRRYCFGDNLVNLLTDYLSNRQLFVHINNYESDVFFAPSGVPQGSNLGPLLFLIFFNDVVDMVQHSQVLLYADDLKLVHDISSIGDSSQLQRDLEAVCAWCGINRLTLNINKCSVITYSRCRTKLLLDYYISQAPLTRVTQITDLGVIFDDGFTFSEHIIQTVSRANKLLGFICRNTRRFKTNAPLDIMFNCLVRSRLEYAVLIWSPIYKKYVYQIETVLSRYAKCKYFRENGVYLWHCRDYLNQYYMLDTLECRRHIISVMFLYNLVNLNLDNEDLLSYFTVRIPREGLRGSVSFFCGTARTNCLVQSPVYRMCRLYNQCCSHLDIFTLGKGEFKKGILEAFRNTPSILV